MTSHHLVSFFGLKIFYLPQLFISSLMVIHLILVRELDVPGDVYERKSYPFKFSKVEMPYETYNGVNV